MKRQVLFFRYQCVPASDCSEKAVKSDSSDYICPSQDSGQINICCKTIGLMFTKPTNEDIASPTDVGIKQECSDNPGFECTSGKECDSLHSKADVLFNGPGTLNDGSRINDTW